MLSNRNKKRPSRAAVAACTAVMVAVSLVLAGCSGNGTGSNTVVARGTQDRLVVKVNKCEASNKDSNGNAVGIISDELLGKGVVFSVPAEVGGNQSPAAMTYVKPGYWMLGGDTQTSVAEPCKTIFDIWASDGNQYDNDLVAIYGCRVVAMAEMPFHTYAKELFPNNDSLVGCFVDIEYDDGHKVRLIIGDTKSAGDGDTCYYYDDIHWGHKLGSGCSVIEVWQNYENPDARAGSEGFHADLAGTMTKITVYENRVQDIDPEKVKLTSKSSASSGSSGGSVSPADPSTFVKKMNDGFNHGDLPKDKAKYIVMHATAGSSADGAISGWGDGPVAAHFVVDKDGTIYQCVPLDKITHHAGWASEGSNSAYGITEERDDNVGRGDAPGSCTDYAMNAWSIGIEIVNMNDNSDPYPEEQLAALDKLVAYIDKELGHAPEITSHREWTGDAEHSKSGKLGQGKTDTQDNFPLGQYKATRTHDGSASGGGTVGQKLDEQCTSNGEQVEDLGEGAKGAVAWAKKVANSKTVGYDQGNRESVQNFDGKTMLESDCSAFAWYSWVVGGKHSDMKDVSSYAPSTDGYESTLPKAGFTQHTITDPNDLRAGDILLKNGHAALYIGGGLIAESSIDENGSISGGEAGDQNQTVGEGEEDWNGEVHINNYYTFESYFRYSG